MSVDRYDDFDRLINHHGKLVRWLCWIYSGGNESLTADLMQEVLLDLWQNRGSLRSGVGEAQERAWVRFRCRSTLQHIRRKKKIDTVPMSQRVLEMMDIGEGMGEVEAQRDLLRSLAVGLTDHERTVLEMLMDNYSVGEIAERLNIKAKSVSQLKLRIIEKMKNEK